MTIHKKASTSQVLSKELVDGLAVLLKPAQRRLDLAPTPNGPGVPKVEKYKWAKLGQKGELVYLDKNDLKVDPSYQREAPTNEWTLNLARNWDWPSCGTITVSERDDQWWVVDGQGRLSAAMQRTDINELPCMVFRNSSIEEEATTFLKVNAHRRSVASFAKYKAALTAKQPLALFVQSHLDSAGLSVGIVGSPKAVACIATLMALAKENKDRFTKMWPLFTHSHQESEIYGVVIKGFWEVERAWDGKKSLTANPHFSKLIRIGGHACLAEIRRLTCERGKGGHAVFRDAILVMLKKKI